jgi:hypothetical protein
MCNKAAILSGIIVFLAIVTLPFWYGSRGQAPKLELPADKKACVESTPYMRAHHAELLTQWRDSTVRDGIHVYKAHDGREYTMSLTGTCLGCHQKKDVFCDRCHTYMKVSPGCWDCHGQAGIGDAPPPEEHPRSLSGKPGSGTRLQGRNIPAIVANEVRS